MFEVLLFDIVRPDGDLILHEDVTEHSIIEENT